jgi:hypothetical protein
MGRIGHALGREAQAGSEEQRDCEARREKKKRNEKHASQLTCKLIDSLNIEHPERIKVLPCKKWRILRCHEMNVNTAVYRNMMSSHHRH